LAAALGAIGLSLGARRLEGGEETFIRASVQGTDAEIFIYGDEAGLLGASVDKRFEAPDYSDGDAVARDFIRQTMAYARHAGRPLSRASDHRRARLSRICVEPLMMVMLMGVLVALVVPNILLRPTRAAIGALALIVAGFCCLALAKTSLWRQGIWTSSGSSRMTKGYTILYRSGWAGIGAGVLLLLLAWRLTP